MKHTALMAAAILGSTALAGTPIAQAQEGQVPANPNGHASQYGNQGGQTGSISNNRTSRSSDNSMTQGQVSVIPAADMVGRNVTDRSGNFAGQIVSMIIDMNNSAVEYVILAGRGGYGTNGLVTAVPWQAIQRVSVRGPVRLDLTANQIRNAPRINRNELYRLTGNGWRSRIYGYYGYPANYGYRYGAYGYGPGYYGLGYGMGTYGAGYGPCNGMAYGAAGQPAGQYGRNCPYPGSPYNNQNSNTGNGAYASNSNGGNSSYNGNGNNGASSNGGGYSNGSGGYSNGNGRYTNGYSNSNGNSHGNNGYGHSGSASAGGNGAHAGNGGAYGNSLAINRNGVESLTANNSSTSPSGLIQANVYAQAGDLIGRINHVMIDLNDGQIAFVLIKRGGWLGLDPTWYAVPIEALDWSRGYGRGYVLDVNQQQLRGLPTIPAINGNLVTQLPRSQLAQLYRQFNLQPYWATGSTNGNRNNTAGNSANQQNQ